MKTLSLFGLGTVLLMISGLFAAYDSADETAPLRLRQTSSNPAPRKSEKQRSNKNKRQRRTKKAAKKRDFGLPAAKIAGEIDAERVSNVDLQDEFPAIAATNDRALWIAYLEWDGSGTDRIMVRRRDASGKYEQPIELTDGCFEHYSPAICARGDDVFVVWSGHDDDGFDLYGCQVSTSRVGTVRRLTKAPQSDFNVRCVSDRAGNVTMVWQSFRELQSDVFARKLTGDVWGDDFRISSSEDNDWEPAVAVDSKGTAWISWDSYAHGNYDVFLRSFDGKSVGETIAVTTERTAQFHSTIAVDHQDRVWIAWDDGGVNWGKDFSRASSAEGSRGLHASRTLGVRVFDGLAMQTPTANISAALTGRMTRYAELPHLTVDGSGAVWMVFRHWTFARPHEIFHFYATKLTGDGWQTPSRLGNSSGRNTQRADTAAGNDGSLWVTYASDGRGQNVRPKDPVHSLTYSSYLANLPQKQGAPEPRLRVVDLPEPANGSTRRQRHTHVVGDKTYTLLFGDCHRHTDVRGHSAVDGSACDTYRYALDVAQLDFLGLGDHNQVTGGDWPDGLRDYQWWFQQKLVDLFTHAPRFIGIYCHEHSLSRPSGHRNLLYLKRGGPLRVVQRTGGGQRNPDNQPPNLWRWLETNVISQPGQKVVVVPHTFASGPLADWNWPNAKFDCLLEIYQGCRGSYEAWRLPDKEKRGPTQTDDPGHFAQDALDRGNIYGFVSFSDHGSTHNSWAGVWAEEPTRESLFDAMLSRRTFGSSDEIILRVSMRAGDVHAVGEQFTADRGTVPTIAIDVTAPDNVLRVDVVKNGKFVYTATPNRRSYSAEFRDMDVEKGKVYYYVRVFQRDPENPSGDPEIAWASPFFVTFE